MFAENLKRRRAKLLPRDPIGFTVFFNKIMGHRHNIQRSFPQRWQSDGHHIETKKEVLPETARSNFFHHIPVAGGKKADIDRDRLRPSNPVNFPLLDRPQKLCLQMGMHFADFIQKKSPPVGLFKFTNTPSHRTGKGAFFMAKQFGFEKIFRNRCTIHGNKWFVFTDTFLVNHPCQDLFTCPRFSCD